MKKSITLRSCVFFLLLLGTVVFSCRKDKLAWDPQVCDEAFDSRGIFLEFFISIVNPSFDISGFNSESSIIAFQSGKNNENEGNPTQVTYEINVRDGNPKKLEKRKSFVSEFDYSNKQGYLFLSDKGMVWLPNNSDQEVVIPMVEPVTQAIWYGDELILNTNEQYLFFMNQSQISWADLSGNIKQQWNVPFYVRDYLVNNKTLIMSTQDSIYGYSFPEMLRIWSCPVSRTTDEYSSAFRYSSNKLSEIPRFV